MANTDDDDNQAPSGGHISRYILQDAAKLDIEGRRSLQVFV